MPTRSLVHPRHEIVQTIERIYGYRMTTTSGGNVSVRDENGDVWITPARIDKGALRAEDIVCVTAAGEARGPHRASSEFPFHQAIYRARPDVRAVVHAHPVALVAFSICRQMPNTAIFPQAHFVCGKVGFAPYALPGSEHLGRNIAAVFAEGADCAMLENHGVVVAGEDLQQAFGRFETLEFCAKTVIKAAHLGPIRYLTAEQLETWRRPRAIVDEFSPGPASTMEKELRQQVAQFVCRAYRQRLFTSTEGSFSARLSDDEFVITSVGIDRAATTPQNLTLVRGGKQEAGKKASRASRIHRAIYQRWPSVKAVVNAMPVNATAFSVTDQRLDARTIPESYLFLRDVTVAPFRAEFGEPDQVAELISPDRPVLIVENDGVLVAGQGVLDTFDRLEVLESTAEAIINSRSVGTVCPMGDATINELMAAFAPKAV